jgi:hypothetical protein
MWCGHCEQVVRQLLLLLNNWTCHLVQQLLLQQLHCQERLQELLRLLMQELLRRCL